MMRRVIWWLRRDLRLTDNITLHYALRDAASILPVFILDPRLLNSDKLARARKQFLFDSLADLDTRLRKRGGRLIVRRGDPARELAKLAKETHADAVYLHRDYTPYARRRDERVTDALNTLGIRLETFEDNYLATPEQVVKDDGNSYTVYTRFRRRLEERILVPNRFATRDEFNTPRDLSSLALPYSPPDEHFARGGETEGLKLARAFLHREDGLVSYEATRDLVARDATSHLSPHLHLGTVSVRELVRAARGVDAGRPGKTWIDELVWREFYTNVLWHFPHAARGAFHREYDGIVWENDAEKFAAWCEGRTGYPIVDAAMQQLHTTGWMPNRARMIVASFLTKDLLIDWRWGEAYFLHELMDGDVASNNGGWQWVAGTGTDVQPFFRIFNPLGQGVKFDPEGAYVKRWIPELTRVPTQYIHAPWTMPTDVARSSGVEIGREYPAPMVDHGVQRARALEIYRRRHMRGHNLPN
jgi:deoxyribodipyrimidine photo-lyase